VKERVVTFPCVQGLNLRPVKHFQHFKLLKNRFRRISSSCCAKKILPSAIGVNTCKKHLICSKSIFIYWIIVINPILLYFSTFSPTLNSSRSTCSASSLRLFLTRMAKLPIWLMIGGETCTIKKMSNTYIINENVL
jgi:hypothetical protein